MSENINQVVRAELEIEGHIYLVEYDKDDQVVLKSEIDQEVVLKLIVAVLDDAINSPLLENTLGVEDE